MLYTQRKHGRDLRTSTLSPSLSLSLSLSLSPSPFLHRLNLTGIRDRSSVASVLPCLHPNRLKLISVLRLKTRWPIPADGRISLPFKGERIIVFRTIGRISLCGMGNFLLRGLSKWQETSSWGFRFRNICCARMLESLWLKISESLEIFLKREWITFF